MTAARKKRKPTPEVSEEGVVAAEEQPAPGPEDGAGQPAEGGPDAVDVGSTDGLVDQPAAGGSAALVEAPEDAVERLEGELEEVQDRLLRTAAEYDNFRRRTAREREVLWGRAQADVVANILDALDDFGRVLDVDTGSATIDDVLEGVELVERKLVRELERAGLERVGEVGEPFDPNQHEAIGAMPAASADQDHTVGSVLQIGYRFAGTLIRPAKVQVFMWQGDAGGGADSELQ